MPRPARRQIRSVRAGTIRLGLVVLALLGVNVYFLGLRGGTSIGALIHATRVRAGAHASNTALAPVARKPSAVLVPLPDDPLGARLVEDVLADGQTVAQALTPLVGKKLATSLEEALSAELDLASVRAGQSFVLVFDSDDRLMAFEFRATNTLAYRVELGTHHKLSTSKLEGRADVRLVDLALPAGPALWDTLKRSGESPALADRLAEVFGGEGDLTGSGAASGERIRVVVEKRLIGGRFLRYGRVLGAEWVTRAGIRRAFFFAGSRPGYYTERGEALARRYLASPLRACRASAQARRTTRALADGRIAIDFVTPPGSVVSAIAEATITGLSRGPGGATVTLEIGPDERVTYSRVTRLARGVAIGATLGQGRGLGRVDAGLTLTYEGAATRYTVGQNACPRLKALSEQERPRFGEQIAPVLERLRALALRASDPLAARALSATP